LGAGADTWGVRADSTAHLAGDLDARASSVLDDDPSTAWQTPFSTLVGQAIDLELAAPVTLDALELDLVADGRHSLPTAFRLVADDGPAIDLAVPPVTSPAPDGSGIASVRLPLPEATTATRWRLEVAGVDIRSTTDWSTLLPFTLPLGIAELDLPGVPPRPEADVDTGCRGDLLTVDADPVAVRITGDPTDPSTAGGLALTACAPEVELPAGATTIRTTAGRTTGLAIDRLVLQTATWSAAPTEARGPAVVTDRAEPGHVTGTVESDGEPFWLVLDESMNDGWELDVEGATVDGPRPVGSYASGWLVTPTAAGSLPVTADWAPQRAVDLALLLSAIGVLGCLALVLRRGRRAPAVAHPLPEWTATPPVPGWGIVIGVAGLAAFVVAPLAAPLGAAAIAAARRWPWAGRVLPVAVIAAAMAAITVLQVGHGYPASFIWPTRFPWAHQAALLAVVVLLGLAVTPDDRATRR
jgi:arabinofuranan 3-O-arabinosyltransferase